MKALVFEKKLSSKAIQAEIGEDVIVVNSPGKIEIFFEELDIAKKGQIKNLAKEYGLKFKEEKEVQGATL